MTGYIEWFGTLASVVVAFSLMMRNLRRLRLINLAGSAMFAAYGAAIGSPPVLVLNVFIVLVDLAFLARMRRERSAFSLLHVDREGSEYLAAFLAFHAADIARFAPEFDAAALGGTKAVFVLRDLVPASLVVYRERDAATVEILLDYATPAYRDYRSAAYFFGAARTDIEASGGAGPRRYLARATTKAHGGYLARMGFTKGSGDEWVLELPFSPAT